MMTITDAAAYLKVSRKTIYKLMRCDELRGFRIGGDWRFAPDAVKRWALAAFKVEESGTSDHVQRCCSPRGEQRQAATPSSQTAVAREAGEMRVRDPERR
jgi:excisionase family DNA binding protein